MQGDAEVFALEQQIPRRFAPRNDKTLIGIALIGMTRAYEAYRHMKLIDV